MPRTQDQLKSDESDRGWVHGIIASAQARGFYGSISLKFEDGTIRRVLKEESLIPPTQPPTRTRAIAGA